MDFVVGVAAEFVVKHRMALGEAFVVHHIVRKVVVVHHIVPKVVVVHHMEMIEGHRMEMVVAHHIVPKVVVHHIDS